MRSAMMDLSNAWRNRSHKNLNLAPLMRHGEVSLHPRGSKREPGRDVPTIQAQSKLLRERNSKVGTNSSASLIMQVQKNKSPKQASESELSDLKDIAISSPSDNKPTKKRQNTKHKYTDRNARFVVTDNHRLLYNHDKLTELYLHSLESILPVHERDLCVDCAFKYACEESLPVSAVSERLYPYAHRVWQLTRTSDKQAEEFQKEDLEMHSRKVAQGKIAGQLPDLSDLDPELVPYDDSDLGNAAPPENSMANVGSKLPSYSISSVEQQSRRRLTLESTRFTMTDNHKLVYDFMKEAKEWEESLNGILEGMEIDICYARARQYQDADVFPTTVLNEKLLPHAKKFWDILRKFEYHDMVYGREVTDIMNRAIAQGKASGELADLSDNGGFGSA